MRKFLLLIFSVAIILFSFSVPQQKTKHHKKNLPYEYTQIIEYINSKIQAEHDKVCRHKDCFERMTTNNTCFQEGELEIVCQSCGKIIETKKLPRLQHAWGEWLIVKTANPVEKGIKQRSCAYCGMIESQEYDFSMNNNSIYVPGIINANFVIGNFNQVDTDRYDIVYNSTALGFPIIFGHDYNSLGVLPNFKIGQNLYLKINNQIYTYKIVVSEEAHRSEDRTNIIGNKTGANLYSMEYSQNAIKLYTCYGNHEWLVIAAPVN